MPKGIGPCPRLIYTYASTAPSAAELTPQEMHNLRLFTGARIVYAFCDARVAGAVCQTNILDYTKTAKHANFGPPLSCLEIKTKDTGDSKSEGSRALGQLVVRGPAAIGGSVTCDQVMAITEEGCLAFPE